jgi:hypothetical protein
MSKYSAGSVEECVQSLRLTGHWKNQPYGPDRSLRKFIYILPYWRGEGGEEERIERQDGEAIEPE